MPKLCRILVRIQGTGYMAKLCNRIGNAEARRQQARSGIYIWMAPKIILYGYLHHCTPTNNPLRTDSYDPAYTLFFQTGQEQI